MILSKKEEKKTGNKKAGKKNASKAKSGKKAQKDVKSVARQSCGTDSTCLLAAGKYFQQVMVKAVNALRRAEVAAAPPPVPTAEETLLGEIRDLLKSGR